MWFPIKVLTLASLAVAIMTALSLVRCAAVQAEVESVGVGDAGVQVDVVQVQVVASEVDRSVTTRELDAYLEEVFPAEWPTKLSEGKLKGYSLEIWAYANRTGIDAYMVVDEVMALTETVAKMQPLFLNPEGKRNEGGVERAFGIAWDVYDETHKVIGTCDEEHADVLPDLNPYLILSMGRRESNFLKRTEIGYIERRGGGKNYDCRWCKGPDGERGMFQLMPSKRRGSLGAAESLMGPDCHPFDRRCNARGAIRWLAKVRCHNIKRFGSKTTIDSWMATYGSKRIVSPSQARHHKSARRAYRYLCTAVDDCSEFWPRDHADDFALSL